MFPFWLLKLHLKLPSSKFILTRPDWVRPGTSDRCRGGMRWLDAQAQFRAERYCWLSSPARGPRTADAGLNSDRAYWTPRREFFWSFKPNGCNKPLDSVVLGLVTGSCL